MVIGSHAHDQVMKTLHITSATVWFTDVLSLFLKTKHSVIRRKSLHPLMKQTSGGKML